MGKGQSEFLGMNYGTASHRLRKKILYSLLVKHNENTCFKCSKLIETIDELSIEHKQPWLHVSIELFWDLDNIAFSHLRCNKADRIGSKKKERCLNDHDLTDPENITVRKDGKGRYCKPCHRAKQKMYRADGRTGKYEAKWREKNRIKYNEYKRNYMRGYRTPHQIYECQVLY